jgi:hypothetical protein
MGPWPRGHQPWSSIILDRASPMSSARHNASTSRPSPPPLLTIAPRVATERQASRPLTRNAVHGFRLGRLCVRLASGPSERPTSFADDRTNRASRALHHAPATYADSGPSTIRGPIAGMRKKQSFAEGFASGLDRPEAEAPKGPLNRLGSTTASPTAADRESMRILRHAGDALDENGVHLDRAVQRRRCALDERYSGRTSRRPASANLSASARGNIPHNQRTRNCGSSSSPRSAKGRASSRCPAKASAIA